MKEKRLRLEEKVFRLQTLCVAMISVFGVVMLSAFAADEKKKFTEIDVERINVVDQDGKLRMVISNKDRQHPGMNNFVPLKRKRPIAGMIFFNEQGDEMGGLVYGNNGGKGHFGQLTWDKVGNDQTIGFRHLESDSGKYLVGLQMWQRPNTRLTPERNEEYKAAGNIVDRDKRIAAFKKLEEKYGASANRLFIGKSRNDSTIMMLNDIKGNPRIKMQVSAGGTPTLEFLDENGKVISSLPASEN